MNKVKNIGVWVVIVLLSLAFVAAGSGKMMGVEQMHASFSMMGLPSWFGYFIGLAEIAGAVGLYLRKTSAWAAAGLFFVMIGAAYFHIAYAVPSAIPAIVLAALTALVFFSRRKEALFIGQSVAV